MMTRFAHENIHVQPTQKTCGQTCISWYLDIPVIEVVKAMGDRKTYPRDLRKYLASRGVEMKQRHGGKLPEIPKCDAMLFAQSVMRNQLFGHWFAIVNQRIFDPQDGGYTRSLGGLWAGRWYELVKLTKQENSARS